MFFILSKILAFFILPFTVICVLLIASVLIRNQRWKKRLFWIAFSMLVFFSNDFISNEAMLAWEVDATPFSEMKKHKLGIVLTGATIPDLKPDDRVYFMRGADRVVHTVQLYKQGLIENILISGGSGRLMGESEPEANKFKKVMLLMGVPEQDIMIENETRNTAESAIEVQKMLVTLRYEDKDCLLITSAFHMRRSLACYRKAGVNLEAFSTDFYAHPRVFHIDVLFVPQLESMVKWHKLCKEWAGIVAYKIAGYI
jgi:uncharacterized SAM-binding protein YcdF (DUF218 family)